MLKTTFLAACLAIVATANAADEPFVRAVQPATERLAELRAKFANDPRMKDAKAAIAAANKAIDQKMSSDPAIAEARRAEQAARENFAKAEQAAAAADPRVQEHRRALEAARARASELEMQRRVEETKTEHLRHEARGRADLQSLWSKAHFDPRSPEAAKTDPRLADASKKLAEANAALDRKMKELPEAKASEQARKEFDEAVKASQGLKGAEAAKRAIEEKIAGDEKVAAQAAKLKAASDAQAEHRKTVEKIEKKIRAASKEAAATDARVAEASRAVDEKRARVSRTTDERIAEERKARQAAQTVWRDKFEAVLNENPEAKALMKEMRSLEERLQQLRTQMGELRRPVTQ